MFSLSHRYMKKVTKLSIFKYILRLLLLIVSFLIFLSIIQIVGWFLLLIGFSLFVVDIREILQKRLRRRLDKPFSFSILAIFIGFSIHVIAFILAIFQVTNQTIWGWLIFLYIIGWIIFSILGYLYKIVPVLWLTHKYSEKMGKEKVPTLA